MQSSRHRMPTRPDKNPFNFMRLERICFLIVTGIATFGAIIHWIAPWMDITWYTFLTSPQWVVDSARAGTWPAPVGAFVVGALMQMCGLYALYATGLLPRIILLRPALCTISLLCTVRGALILPMLWMVPEKLTAFDITASMVWLVAGVCMTIGTVLQWKMLRSN